MSSSLARSFLPSRSSCLARARSLSSCCVTLFWYCLSLSLCCFSCRMALSCSVTHGLQPWSRAGCPAPCCRHEPGSEFRGRVDAAAARVPGPTLELTTFLLENLTQAEPAARRRPRPSRAPFRGPAAPSHPARARPAAEGPRGRGLRAPEAAGPARGGAGGGPAPPSLTPRPSPDRERGQRSGAPGRAGCATGRRPWAVTGCG